MPKFFRALMATLLAVIVLFAFGIQADPLAPDHVPRTPMLALDPTASLTVPAIDNGQHKSPKEQREMLQPNLIADSLAYAALPALDPG